MTISASATYYDLKHNSCMRANNLYMCVPLAFPSTALFHTVAFIQLWHLICKIFSLKQTNILRVLTVCICSCQTLWYAHWQTIPGTRQGPQTSALCWGFWASWLLRMGLGARLCSSAKKVSEPTSATCFPPSESGLPAWEVRERDTGQFQETTVAISAETEGVQEPIY